MQVLQCNDYTCRFNQDGFCQNAFPKIEVGADSNNKPANICVSYKDKRKEDV